LFLIARRLLHCICTETAQRGTEGTVCVPDVRLGVTSGLQRVPNDVRFTPANAERMLHV
jgi:hypothetical protein